MAAVADIFDVDGVAIITGGASGFGLEAASRCVAAGMRVVIADIEADALESALETLTQQAAADPGGADRVLACQTDVSKEASIRAMVGSMCERWPGARVAFVFNNAGVFNNLSVLEATEKDWQFVLGVNVVGVRAAKFS